MKFTFLLPCFALFACSSENCHVPCEYDITVLPAKVVAILPGSDTDSTWHEVQFVVDAEGRSDTLYYTRNFPGFVSDDDIKKHGLQPGNTFRYEHHVIKKGDCSPDFYVLKLERYEKSH